MLQALQGLNPTPPPAEPRRPASQGPSRAFLPARPDRSTLTLAGTGVIDVRALATMGLRRAQATAAPAPSPALGPAAAGPAVRPASPAAGPVRPSPQMLQVRAFLLGVLCTGALTGVLLVRVAAVTADRAAPSVADAGRGQPGPSAAGNHARP